MILRGLLLCFSLMVSAAGAADILVQAGEHEDFSRLVLQLPEADDWTFGKVNNGYELRLDSTRGQFDFTEVFRKIPKSRIKSVSGPASGRVFLEVSCDCHADAFEIRNGRIVLDIKDGPPEAGSAFEAVLPDPSDVADVLRPAQSPPDQTQAEQATGSPVGAVKAGVFQQRSSQPVAAEFSRSSDPNDKARDSLSKPPMTDKRVGLRKPVSLDNQLLPLFGFETGSLESADDSIAADRRLTALEDALLKQMGRASSQGLIEVLPVPSLSEKPQTTGNPQPAHPIPATTPNVADRGKSQHIRIETAVDRAATTFDAQDSMTFDGDECLSGEYFDVASWGNKYTGSGLSIGAERAVLGEFDVPMADEVKAAVRRYIYLGFGAEAKALLAAFSVTVERADILWQLAEIVDDPDTARATGVRTQISCKTAAALWSVLASPDFRPGEPVEAATVVQTFSGLPIHLRRHLGPALAARFLNADDPASATSIRNMITRNPGVSENGVGLLQARIDAELGRTEASLEQLRRVVAEGGADSTEALVELIDAQFAAGQTVDPLTSQLAEAFAYENKGTRIGQKLNLTAIRGMIASQRIEAAFAAIRSAQKEGGLSAAESADLLASAHLKNAEASSNIEFLRLLQIFGYPANTPEAWSARRAVSERLLDLGFGDQARALLLAEGQTPDRSDRIDLAEAALADRKPELALSYLAGLANEEVPALRAKALEMTGNTKEAARIYQAEEMAADASRAAWIAADWDTVAVVGTEPQRAIAKLLSPAAAVDLESTAEGPADNTAKATADVVSAPDPETALRSGRTLVDRSMQVRQALAALLAAN